MQKKLGDKEILERQHAEIVEKERKRREQEELEKKEKEKLLTQEEMKAEIQRLRMEKEETQRKAQRELEAVRRARDENTTQVEEKGKAKSQKTPTPHEQAKDTSQQVPIMNAIPLSTMLPARSSHIGVTPYPGQAAAEKTWNEILTQHGYKPKKQSSSSKIGKAPRGYTKQMFREFLDKKKAEEKEQLEKVTQTSPPPGPGPK